VLEGMMGREERKKGVLDGFGDFKDSRTIRNTRED